LGFLAGGILKESRDLDFPLIGISFMYPQVYVKQRIRNDGWQEDLGADFDKENMPARRLLDENGNPVKG